MTDCEFKVGWVYKDHHKDTYLIHHIWNDERLYPIIASSPDPDCTGASTSYTLEGRYSCFSDYFKKNKIVKEDLILKTGKIWKPDND